MIRVLPFLLLLGGCAAESATAPSLLPRPIESRSNDEPVVTPATAEPDAALDREIAAKVAAFDKAASAFVRTERSAGAKLARAKGAAQGSETWLDAQAILADVATARATTDGAMGELEGLAMARAEKNLPPYPALDAAVVKARTELERENDSATKLLAAGQP